MSQVEFLLRLCAFVLSLRAEEAGVDLGCLNIRGNYESDTDRYFERSCVGNDALLCRGSANELQQH